MQTEAHCDEHNLDFITENLCPACIEKYGRKTERDAGSESRSSEWLSAEAEMQISVAQAQALRDTAATALRYALRTWWSEEQRIDMIANLILKWRKADNGEFSRREI